MPRLSPTLIRQAASIDRNLPSLLRECRDLGSARRELRWLQEEARELDITRFEQHRTLQSWIHRRSRGEPIQYILGNQPFGELDIKVEPGVLIPRPETETYVEQLGGILSKFKRTNKGCLRVADFCTGTGCVALGIASQLRSISASNEVFLQVRGFDISSKALTLANRNLSHNRSSGGLPPPSSLDLGFEYLDVLGLAKQSVAEIRDRLAGNFSGNQPDIIMSNPPYISAEQYRPGGDTSKSVRLYEPKLALVPPEELLFAGICRADQFYAAILKITLIVRPKVLLMEVGDSEQALRIRQLCRQSIQKAQLKARIEIWKDDMSIVLDEDQVANSRLSEGYQARAVVLWLDQDWIKQRSGR